MTQVLAEELEFGDVIESHDGLTHEVIDIERYRYRDVVDMIRVTVQKGDGRYTTEFPSDHRIALDDSC